MSAKTVKDIRDMLDRGITFLVSAEVKILLAEIDRLQLIIGDTEYELAHYAHNKPERLIRAKEILARHPG